MPKRAKALDAAAAKRHAAWLASEEGGERLEVEGATIKGLRAIGWDLRLASFVDTTFEGCDFTLLFASGLEAERCRFVRCSLDFAKLDGARLVACGFAECHAVGLHLDGARLDGGTFVDTGLGRSAWRNAVAEEVVLAGADLWRADLAGARFVECDLRGAMLDEADRTGTVFEDCRT